MNNHPAEVGESVVILRDENSSLGIFGRRVRRFERDHRRVGLTAALKYKLYTSRKKKLGIGEKRIMRNMTVQDSKGH